MHPGLKWVHKLEWLITCLLGRSQWTRIWYHEAPFVLSPTSHRLGPTDCRLWINSISLMSLSTKSVALLLDQRAKTPNCGLLYVNDNYSYLSECYCDMINIYVHYEGFLYNITEIFSLRIKLKMTPFFFQMFSLRRKTFIYITDY